MAREIKASEAMERLKELPGWSLEGESIEKTFEVNDFVAAVELVNRLVPPAEEMNHHPDIRIQNYNEVVVSITTHDDGALTELDFRLARRIEDTLET